ncbi:patatin-like phospholipase family protein [Afipia sp. GAS231]|uniref:patatin-like phospholipase family protein n=1 Tax=Afipia sp. GAS231 TaxID=1882747 RepID=UPI0012FC846E|nr:patatin-like phospholipase family protein [Afipia sp. GAS231]
MLAAIGGLMRRLAAPIVAYCPPWWAWVALTIGLVPAGCLVRRRSLRALEVAPPTNAERAQAAAAGRAIAASGPVGLVLGGGGAKGAYQVGCWKALRDSGIVRFGAIAGTSVGALNAVLVAQDEFDRAERIWNNMSFGRVLQMRWWSLLVAVAIRVVLIVPYLGKFKFPARAIPVSLYRATHEWQQAWRAVEPLRAIAAVLRWYFSLLKQPRSNDWIAQFTLVLIAFSGLAGWWYLALPLFEVAVAVIGAPFLALCVVNYASWLATALDLLATRLVLASNTRLAELISECVNPEQLKAHPTPVFVTLGALREVQRTVAPRLLAHGTATGGPAVSERSGIIPTLDRDFGGLVDGASLPTTSWTMEYVPNHFNVCTEPPGRMRELILQSAGLPEIFPARQFDGVTYVDGGIADNEPLAALVDLPGHRTIIVMPLNNRGDEARIRTDLSRVLERLGRPPPATLPELLVLTPSRPLGNILVGTMDFAAERARAMMRLGYRDTIVRLAGRVAGEAA